MTETKKTFTEQEFKNLCEFVCQQMSPSNSKEVDRETLYFAIYWKICDLTGQKLFTKLVAESKISDYRDKIRKSLNKPAGELFDAAEIVDRIIGSHIDSGRNYESSNANTGPRPVFAFSTRKSAAALKN